VVPAGQPSFRTFVAARPIIPTAAIEALNDAQLSPDDVEILGGLRARVVSLTGEDFSEIERIELRACPVGSTLGCQSLTSLVFSQGDLFRRRQQSIALSPGVLNFKTLFLGNDNIRLELVFQPGITTSRTIEARLEWAMAAFGEQ